MRLEAVFIFIFIFLLIQFVVLIESLCKFGSSLDDHMVVMGDLFFKENRTRRHFNCQY